MIRHRMHEHDVRDGRSLVQLRVQRAQKILRIGSEVVRSGLISNSSLTVNLGGKPREHTDLPSSLAARISRPSCLVVRRAVSMGLSLPVSMLIPRHCPRHCDKWKTKLQPAFLAPRANPF